MPLHERTKIVSEAGYELTRALILITDKYELTFAEMIHVLNERIFACVKYAIRAERHPNDPTKGGDEA